MSGKLRDFFKKFNTSDGWRASLLRYIFISLFTTAIHYLLYLLFDLILDPRIAYTISYAIELTINYLLSSSFTFSSARTKRNGLGFVLVRIISYLLEIILLSFFLWVGVPEEYAPLPVFVCAGLFNFLSLYNVVFKKRK